MGGSNNLFRGRRLAAVLGAMTLSVVGVVAASTPASAADDYGNINTSKTGSIVIHKHVHQVTATRHRLAGRVDDHPVGPGRGCDLHRVQGHRHRSDHCGRLDRRRGVGRHDRV